MKSKNTLAAAGLLFLLLAVAMSVVLWPEVSTAAKVAFFAFGYGSGVTGGAWLAGRRQKQ